MYRFTNSLPYLLNRVGVRMGELFANELASERMTIPMYRVLAALSEMKDQRLTDLCGLTTVEMTTLSRLIATMEKRGWVIRRRPADNLRTVQISLTTAGHALAKRLMPRAAYYEQVAMRGLGDGEVARLKCTLGKVFDNLGHIEREQQEKRRPGPRPSKAA